MKEESALCYFTEEKKIVVDPQKGITLRDYFATHANEEDIKYWQPTGELVERVAVTSSGKVIYQESGKYTREQARYLYADAMLKAREA